MKFCVIGYGKVGKLYSKTLKELGHELYLVVDTKRAISSLSNIYEIKKADVSSIDLIIISSPTNLHVSHFLKLVEIFKSKKNKTIVVIEKPSFYKKEFEKIKDIPEHFHVIFRDNYGNSNLIAQLKECIQLSGGENSLETINIEFSKNRLNDEKNGRFIDPYYGVIGYESYHMIAILRSLLSKNLFATYLDSKPIKISRSAYNIDEVYSIEGIKLNLTTDIEGNIKKSFSIFQKLYTENNSKKMIASKIIPEGNEFRFRFIDIRFKDGKRVGIVFEYSFGNLNLDVKNNHLIYKISHDGRLEVVTSSCNIFKQTLEKQLSEVVEKSNRSSMNEELRVAEKMENMLCLTQEDVKESICL